MSLDISSPNISYRTNLSSKPVVIGTGNGRTRAFGSSRKQALWPRSNSSLASSHLNTGANPSSSTPNHHPVETQIGSTSLWGGAEGSWEDTGDTDDASLSSVNERLPTTVSQFNSHQNHKNLSIEPVLPPQIDSLGCHGYRRCLFGNFGAR